MNRSLALLLLCVVLLLAVWYAWTAIPRQQRVEGGKTADRTGTVASADRSATAAVTLDFSGGEMLPYKKPKRDLFRPLYRAPAVVKKATPAPKPAPAIQSLPRPVISLPVVKTPTRAEPIPPLKVLGFLRNGGSTTVFLASQQGDLYLVKKGDRFADGLLLRELSDSAVVISRNQNDAGVTLKIGGQKNQRLAIPNVLSGRPSIPTYKTPVPKAMPAVSGSGKVKVVP